MFTIRWVIIFFEKNRPLWNGTFRPIRGARVAASEPVTAAVGCQATAAVSVRPSRVTWQGGAAV